MNTDRESGREALRPPETIEDQTPTAAFYLGVAAGVALEAGRIEESLKSAYKDGEAAATQRAEAEARTVREGSEYRAATDIAEARQAGYRQGYAEADRLVSNSERQVAALRVELQKAQESINSLEADKDQAAQRIKTAFDQGIAEGRGVATRRQRLVPIATFVAGFVTGNIASPFTNNPDNFSPPANPDNLKEGTKVYLANGLGIELVVERIIKGRAYLLDTRNNRRLRIPVDPSLIQPYPAGQFKIGDRVYLDYGDTLPPFEIISPTTPQLGVYTLRPLGPLTAEVRGNVPRSRLLGVEPKPINRGDRIFYDASQNPAVPQIARVVDNNIASGQMTDGGATVSFTTRIVEFIGPDGGLKRVMVNTKVLSRLPASTDGFGWELI